MKHLLGQIFIYPFLILSAHSGEIQTIADDKTKAIPVAGIATLEAPKFDGSISQDVECGATRVDCKVVFGATSLQLSDGSTIDYSTIIDIQGGDLAFVECAKELPTLPYEPQGKGFPCWVGRPSWYVLIANKAEKQGVVMSVFSFKNAATFKRFLMNTFAARFSAAFK